MGMEIVLASDNHGNLNAIRKIIIDNPTCDYYWHLGDSCLQDVSVIRPFISIKGNNDFDSSLPLQRIIEIDKYRFLLIHGHRLILWGLDDLYEYAKELNCNVVLYGHTHIFDDRFIDDIHFINPGSCSHNRNGEEPTYCLIELKDKELIVTKKYVNN